MCDLQSMLNLWLNIWLVLFLLPQKIALSVSDCETSRTKEQTAYESRKSATSWQERVEEVGWDLLWLRFDHSIGVSFPLLQHHELERYANLKELCSVFVFPVMGPRLLKSLLLHSHDILLRLLSESSRSIDHLVVNVAVELACLWSIIPGLGAELRLVIFSDLPLFPVLGKVIVSISKLAKFFKLVHVFNNGIVLECVTSILAQCFQFRECQLQWALVGHVEIKLNDGISS